MFKISVCQLSFTCLLPVTLAFISAPLFSAASQAQEYPDCWAINQAGEFVDLSYMCPEKSDENSESVDNTGNSQENSESVVNNGNSQQNPTQNVSNQNVTSPPKKGRCQYPDQRDARGRLCGDRASTKRPGGNGL